MVCVSFKATQTYQRFLYTGGLLPSFQFYCTFLPPSSQFYLLKVGPMALPFQCLTGKNNRKEGIGRQQETISNGKCDQITQCTFLGQRRVGKRGVPFWGAKRWWLILCNDAYASCVISILDNKNTGFELTGWSVFYLVRYTQNFRARTCSPNPSF